MSRSVVPSIRKNEEKAPLKIQTRNITRNSSSEEDTKKPRMFKNVEWSSSSSSSDEYSKVSKQSLPQDLKVCPSRIEKNSSSDEDYRSSNKIPASKVVRVSEVTKGKTVQTSEVTKGKAAQTSKVAKGKAVESSSSSSSSENNTKTRVATSVFNSIKKVEEKNAVVPELRSGVQAAEFKETTKRIFIFFRS